MRPANLSTLFFRPIEIDCEYPISSDPSLPQPGAIHIRCRRPILPRVGHILRMRLAQGSPCLEGCQPNDFNFLAPANRFFRVGRDGT